MKVTFRISEQAKEKIVALAKQKSVSQTEILNKIILTYKEDLTEEQINILSVKKSLRNCEFLINVLQSALNNLFLDKCENATTFYPLKQNTHMFIKKAKGEEESRLRLLANQKKWGDK